ncbi:MAG: hypothetical protein JO051_09250 [Acidobacteriaceae bacterium]|nr:hypothetical protein [Acidobacteriaceae bacterium]
MKVSKPALLIASLLLLASCSRLPNQLRREIARASDRLTDVNRQLQHSQDTLASDLSQAPDLFRDATAPVQWTARLQSDRDNLASARKIQNELEDLARRGPSDSQFRAEQLLTQERQLLNTAATDSQAIVASAGAWLDFGRNIPSHLQTMQREYTTVSSFDLAPVSTAVAQAEHDWPSKKTTLDECLDSLRAIPKQAQSEWNSTQPLREAGASGKVSGTQLATLIQTDDDLANDAHTLTAKANELHSLCGQLYVSWDKILTDLDDSRDGRYQFYRERIKTVRTHILDVALKKSETTSEQTWVDVSEPQFRAVENDLGMAIAHKDAGLFDSEAQTTPQPAGFAYIAPESEGSNRYGYWDHSGGHSIWTWLPEYLILRELLWNHDYHPVIADEYRAYRTAQTAGRTFYGQAATPTAPPKYGSHGTFTQTHYADSRYVQHGGFSSSAYASHPGSAASAPRPMANNEPEAGGAGRRFGSGAHPPSGHQFGRPGGFRSPGRRFGRR